MPKQEMFTSFEARLSLVAHSMRSHACSSIWPGCRLSLALLSGRTLTCIKSTVPYNDDIITGVSVALWSESNKTMLLSIRETQSLLSVLALLPADEPIDLQQLSHSHATCHGKFVAHI
jgi:hypothetical protein